MVVRVKPLRPVKARCSTPTCMTASAIYFGQHHVAIEKAGEPEAPPDAMKVGDVVSSESKGHTPISLISGAVDFEVLDVELLHRPTTSRSRRREGRSLRIPARPALQVDAGPGTTSAMHTHERPYLVLLGDSAPAEDDRPKGESMTHEVKPGDFHMDRCQGHALAVPTKARPWGDCGD